LTNSDAWYSQADWSPDGSRIALLAAESKVSGDADLAVLDLTSRELTRITEGPAIDMEPSWSPDAAQIAFSSDRDGALDIYTLNVDSGEITQLTQDAGDNNHPDWSPDGQNILFVSSRDGDEEIYVMDADGANPLRLTSTPERDVDPEWSPDGKTFAYGHEESGVRSIYISDLNGSPPELLFELSAEANSGHPAWTMAAETIPEGPVFGPPFCVRDSDGDSQPDTIAPTLTTEDDLAFIAIPYDHMQDGMDFWYKSTVPGEVSFVGENHPAPWDGGEEGVHFTFLGLQNSTGVLKVEFYIGEKLMQTIECEIVEP
jgi:dipeptidyl aminopeptidase/acylaminoacyl peptidase